ncbi:MAG: dienelactone hydrolase family protein [Acidobacteria bacterium]|nr:dienelactone hydrolase family protein [Acidobacteriota bacterium]
MADIQEIISKVVSKVPDAQVMSDLDAAAAWAEKSGSGDEGRPGITGFCWGGRIVWLYAAHNAKVKAGAAWYGRLVGNATPDGGGCRGGSRSIEWPEKWNHRFSYYNSPR